MWVGWLFILLTWLFKIEIFPYIAVKKVRNGELKTACAYVVGTEKAKYSDNAIIRIDDVYYTDLDILPLSSKAAFFNRDEWLKFPLGQNYGDFLKVEPNVCKKVRYVEVYHLFGLKKIYLYDYVKP